MAKYLFAFIFAATIISAATAQESSKESNAAIQDAINYAESVAFVHTDKNTGVFKSMLNPKNIEHPAFVFYMGNGEDALIKLNTVFGKDYYELFHNSNRMRNTNLYGGRAYITFAGTCTLLVPRNGSIVEANTSGTKRFEVDTLTFNFEEGKYYTIDSRTDKENKIKFSIKETDTTPYLAYQTANPNRLNGTWSGKGKRLLTTFLNQYYFNGSRMKFEGESKNPKQTFVAEGEIMYNENTIIFFPKSAGRKGKEVEDFNSRADRLIYIWYYTLTGNELHIEEGNPFLIGLQVWVNTGIFQKIN